MNIIGITGGIGSGKTTVCKIFELLGISVYYADDSAKHLMVHDPQVVSSIQQLLGAEAYLPDGSLNRKWIGSQVFNDRDKLNQLNAIVHPATREDFRRWVEEKQGNTNDAFVLREAAILFEAGAAADTDGVITVYAPKSIRIRRVMERDHVSQEEVLKRMANQWADTEKIRRADLTIYNDGTHMVVPQVLSAKAALETRPTALKSLTAASQ